MSSATSITASNKASLSPAAINYSQGPASSGFDLSQKRSNSSGGHGAGLQTRQGAQSRNQQTSKKPNKAQKRAKILDDGAADDEIAAMRSINSRKGQTSITHLMSFSLPPRPQYQPQHQNHRSHQRYNKTWGLGSGYHAIDKAKYVHANYRFIVRPDRQYHAQTVDADVHVGWDAVLQILASADLQKTNCPICLSDPVAPRMAKCGHICCLPCLIRYMHSSDDANPLPDKRARWKKCPICEDSIYLSEVRPVRYFAGQEATMLREGGDVLLRLLKRSPGSTLAMPRDAADNYGHHQDIPWFNVAEMLDYSRFTKAGEEYMTEQYDQEIFALEEQEREDELMFGDDTTWTRKAVNSIRDAKQRVEGLANPSSARPETDSHLQVVPESWDIETIQSDTTSALSNGIARLSFNEHNAGPRPRAPFYYYNALPNFYLSPLDIRILKAAFGEFAAFPSTILPRVEHISTGHLVDDELRKRAKYMGHLPYGAEVSMLECDWTDIISPAILEQFSEEINRRRRRNTEKEAREERDRIRAEREEDDKRWAAARRRRPSIPEKSLSEADFASLATSPPLVDALAMTPPWGNQRTHSAFATLASPGTSPDGPRTVWGTAAIAPGTPEMPTMRLQQPVDDGWLQDWERDLLDEADAVALVAASTGEASSSKAPVTAGKKKKNKKITLMSTNARRGA